MRFRRTGFTLIELMVVIAIIGILAGALMLQVNKSRDSARAMRCKVNLKNLAQAAMNYGVETTWFPLAGSYETAILIHEHGDFRTYYIEHAGWVDWTDRPPGRRVPDKVNPANTARCCAQSNSRDDPARKSIRQGTLWGLMGKNFSTYVCDEHKKAGAKNGEKRVVRSYVMNSLFGYDDKIDPKGCATWRRVGTEDIASRGSAGTLLLFAELPIYKPGSGKPHKYDFKGKNAGDWEAKDPCWADGVLMPEDGEYIGFNHLVANRYVAHVVFADGHVEALAEPANATVEDLKKLTGSLCNGDEIDKDIRSRMH